MDNIKSQSCSNMDSSKARPKNGTSFFHDLNCTHTFKLESKNAEQLNEIVFNTDALQNIKTLILRGTDLQNLPNSFTHNFGNLIHLNLKENKLSHLPSNMKNLAKLQHLNISNNCLKALTEDFGLLNELQVLLLENNNLTELSNIICSLSNLVQINIADNNLKTIPDNIGKLQYLERLDFSGNMLENLPESMSELKNLSYFSAASNKLSELPKGFTHLNKLTVLILSYNAFYDVPFCLFTGLPKISILDLSHNYINDFSEVPKCANKLRKLNFSHNCLFCMPRWVFRDTCRNLLELNFSYNRYMNGIGEDFHVSPCSMKILDVSDCNLTTNSVCFLRGLHNLESLIMSNRNDPNSRVFDMSKQSSNVFWDLPMNVLKHAGKLQELIVSGAGLAALQDDIVQLSSLQHLDLHSNELNWLPDSFCDLVMLKTCNLSHNKLALLPGQLGKLVRLRELNLDGNMLHVLPESLSKLENLEFLDLYDNIFDEVPSVIKNMTDLKGLDLEYNCFDVTQITDSNFLDVYSKMKCNIRTRLSGNSEFRIDYKKAPLDVDVYSSEDDHVSLCSEDIENNDYEEKCEGINAEEENWDDVDEFNDTFDPTVLPPIPKSKPEHRRRALLVVESLLNPNRFCPADIHPPPIKSTISINWTSSAMLHVEEGQFDDLSLE